LNSKNLKFPAPPSIFAIDKDIRKYQIGLIKPKKQTATLGSLSTLWTPFFEQWKWNAIPHKDSSYKNIVLFTHLIPMKNTLHFQFILFLSFYAIFLVETLCWVFFDVECFLLNWND
jgi:hypothetical protein